MSESRHTTRLQGKWDLTAGGIRGRSGDITYAKSWCGFGSRDESKSGPYYTWREQIKAYITALSWKPGSLTDDQLDSVVKFARSLPPVNSRITLIKTKHRQEDAVEVQRQLRHLVKDIGRKLQATIDRLYASQAEDALNAEDTEPESKCSLLFTVRFAIRLVLNIFSRSSMRMGFSLFPKGDKASHYPSDRRS